LKNHDAHDQKKKRKQGKKKNTQNHGCLQKQVNQTVKKAESTTFFNMYKSSFQLHFLLSPSFLPTYLLSGVFDLRVLENSLDGCSTCNLILMRLADKLKAPIFLHDVNMEGKVTQ
jgi:hypothetical protein